LLISAADLNNIKKLPPLCVSASRCFLTAQPAAVRSLTGVASAVTVALPARTFGLDYEHPTLLQFSLNMDSAVMVLSFSKTINVSAVQPTFMRLSSRPDVSATTSSNQTYTLTGAQVVTSGPDTTVTLVLSVADMNILKARRIALSNSTTWLTALENSFIGMNGRGVLMAGNVSAMLASGYVPDTTSPTLLSFSASMNAGTLSLTFSETVQYTSLAFTGMPLAATANLVPAVTLTNSSGVEASDSTILVVHLSDSDLNRIKALDSLLRNQTTTFLQLLFGAAVDIFGNPVLSSGVLAPVSFVPDTTAPRLVSFTMDQSSAIVDHFNTLPTISVTMQFSESVRLRTLRPTGLTLQSASQTSAQTQRYTLLAINTSTQTPDMTVVVFKMSVTDANAIKLLPLLAKSLNSTFASITAALIADMVGNGVQPIVPSAALRADSYAPDNQPPQLYHFTMDLNRGACVLVFDEPVLGMSLEPPQMTLQDAVQQASHNLTLTGGLGQNGIAWVSTPARASFDSSNGTVLTIFLTANDLNALKADHFCRGSNDCYLVHTGLMVRDIAGNYIRPCS